MDDENQYNEISELKDINEESDMDHMIKISKLTGMIEQYNDSLRDRNKSLRNEIKQMEVEIEEGKDKYEPEEKKHPKEDLLLDILNYSIVVVFIIEIFLFL